MNEVHVAKPGEYADILRILGRFFEQQQGHHIELIDEGEYLRVSWITGSGQQERTSYRSFELDRLRQEACALRAKQVQDAPTPGLLEYLRAIGSEVDRLGYELLSLKQESDGFQVTMLAGHGHVTTTYKVVDLARLTLEQWARRRPLAPESKASSTLSKIAKVAKVAEAARLFHGPR